MSMNTGLDMNINTEVFRKNFPIIIAVNRHQATLLPMRVEFDADGYFAGQVMAKRTSNGLFTKYAPTGSDGTDTAVSVLFEDVMNMKSTSAPSGSDLARGIFGGTVFKDKLIGLDSDAVTDLKGRTISDASGINLFKF